ncbi:MAG: DM13 domain-containing protein, partial [Alphaproteobacteria bacterium]|nr:DM13 domain-containing protein [Alphaproteobacteria bacterium]
MKRLIATFVVGGALGAAAGFAAGIFIYPFIFLADIEAMEKVEDPTKPVVATGRFIHANPSDPIHFGKGSVTVYEDVVHLEQDFEVGPGPKFHVYLVPLEKVTPSTEVTKTMYVDLGRLRAFKGSQNFPIPAGVALRNYKSVIIWCEH